MISPQEFIDMIAQAFFQGNTQIAGIVVFTAVIAIVFLLFAQRNIMIGLILTLPVTLIFSMMNVLPETLTVLIIIVVLIALIYKFREIT